MMHCDRCNIDFPEGLRYCKWCGQTLTERARSTGEIQTCPSCFSGVQSSWAFCKACGARLTGQAQEPLSAVCPRCSAVTDPGALNCMRCGEDLTAQSQGSARQTHGDVTAVFAHCPTCGEAVDSGSMYCKACGSALYSQPSPFGTSALLCSVCQSYSPIGSTICRVCGAALGAAIQETVETAAEKKRSSTLPDLADHFPAQSSPQPTGPADQPGEEIESGAHTITFKELGETKVMDRDQSPTTKQVDLPAAASQQKRGADTTVLPGVAGSKAENVGLTSTMQRPRITSPVEGEEESSEAAKASAEEASLETLLMPAVASDATPAASDTVPPDSSETPAGPAGAVTRMEVEVPNAFYFDEGQSSGSLETKSVADESTGTGSMGSPATVVFGSGTDAPPAFESDDYRATGGWKDEATISHQEVVRDEASTAPFGLEEPPADRGQATGAQAGTVELERASPADLRTEGEAAGRPGEFNTREASTGDFASKPEPWTPVTEQPAQPALPVEPVAQAPKKGGAMIASVIVVILVLGATGFALWWYVLGGKPAIPAPQPAAENPPSQPAAPPTAPKPVTPTATAAPEGMEMVPAGTYLVGRDDASDLERPQHPVELKSFYIDRTEVTNADYKKFVDATGHKPPSNWAGGAYPEGRDNYPVTGVTWQDAADYAQWAGKRLPTEAEWEAAVRGTDGRLYPWGNEWRPGLANIGIKSSASYDATQYPSEIAAAGRFSSGASPVGAIDLIGNVWEWTADEFTLYPDNPIKLEDITVGRDRRKIKLEPGITYRIFRGGAFDGDQQHDASYRGLIDASKPYPKVGFRCVKDAR